jgi:hypothetical protein
MKYCWHRDWAPRPSDGVLVGDPEGCGAMAIDGRMRTSQVSCYESTIVNFMEKDLSHQCLLFSRLATLPMSMGFINKQDDKIVHKKAFYALLFRFTSNERAIFQMIRQSKEATRIFSSRD